MNAQRKDPRKITQVLNYLARYAGSDNVIRRIKAIKLIYFADRYHLRKYARLVTEDTYYGMKYGPVASLTLDIARKQEGRLTPEQFEYAKTYIDWLGANHYRSIKEVEDSLLSETDKEALDFSIKSYNSVDEFDLCKASHAYPEYDKKKGFLNFKELMKLRFSIDLKEFFNDPNPNHQDLEVLNHKDYLHDEINQASRKIFEQKLSVNKAIVENA